MGKIEAIVKIIIVFLLAAVLAGGIGYMVWFFGFKPADKSEDKDPAITIPTDIEIDKGGVIF